MAKKFNLGDYLKTDAVSELNTEQIVLIDVDRIDPDPDNFYSLEGIDELAGNIELIGLQQPLRVRPAGERFVIVSGHRRRAAILLIRDGGSDQFAQGVTCIVEYGEASPAMRELRLIYANSSTRVMSSAEISKQAERVTELLYQLKEQGVDFPGRMREHVAQACQVSESKLARLHAIRSNLDSELLPYYDSGALNEDAAYQLSRFPANLQTAIARELSEGKRKKMPVASTVKAVYENLDTLTKPLPCRAHAGGPDCRNVEARVICSVFAPYYWQICDGTKCCMDCFRGQEGCRMACTEAKDRVKLDKAVKAEKEAEQKKLEENKQDVLRKRITKRCKELLPLIDAAGMADDERIYDSFQAAKVKDVRAWAEGKTGDRHFYSDECIVPWRVGDLRSMAKRLKITAAEILGEKPEPLPSAPAPAWQTGEPDEPGWYCCWAQWVDKYKGALPAYDPDYETLFWNGTIWTNGLNSTKDAGFTVHGWVRLPDPPDVET